MRRLALIATLFVAVPVFAQTTSPAAAEPSTRPAIRDARNREAGGGRRMIQAFRTALDELDLTKDQKTKTDAALAEAREKLSNLQPGDGARDTLREVNDDLRKKILEVLTPDQRETIREKMIAAMRNGGNRAARENSPSTPAAPVPSGAPRMEGDAMMTPGDATMGGAMPSRDGAPRGSGSRAKSPSESQKIAEVGDAAPELAVRKLDGTPVRLSTYKGRPVLLVFGSYTAPTFREKAPLLAELGRDYGSRVAILVVYTAEAYPVGSWEVDRNRDENIRTEQHKSEDERVAAAKAARAALKLEGLAFVVDDLSDITAKAYSNTPNACVLIGKDGRVAARQGWLEPFALRNLLDDALKPISRQAQP